MITILTRSTVFPTNILLKNAAKKHAIPLKFINPFEETIETKLLDKNTIILPRCSGVLFDDIDLHLAEDWEYLGYSVVNKTDSLRLLRDKDRQFLKLERENLRPLPFVLLRGKPELALELLEERLGEPRDGYLVKSIRSNQGKGQYKASDISALEKLWREFLLKQDQRYLVTPFMDNFTEYRAFFIGEEIYAVEKSEGLFGHQRNADNCDFTKVELDSELKELTLKIKNSFGLFYGAIDFVKWNNQNFVLEINGLPGMAQMQKALEIDLAEKLLLSLN